MKTNKIIKIALTTFIIASFVSSNAQAGAIGGVVGGLRGVTTWNYGRTDIERTPTQVGLDVINGAALGAVAGAIGGPVGAAVGCPNVSKIKTNALVNKDKPTKEIKHGDK